MPYTAPTVNYSATNNGTYTTLTGVQSVSIRRGRQRFQDPVTQSTCTIELIPANSYTLPLAIGQFIDVRDANTSTSPCYFTGQITDVTRTYDIPYNSTTGAAPGDRITITASGGTGAIGSATLTGYSMPSQGVALSLQDIISSVGVYWLASENLVLNSAQTLNTSALDAVNTLLQTGQYLIDDLDRERTGTTRAICFYPITGRNTYGFEYSDTGATRFKTLEYQSSAQNTFNYVEVEPAGLTAQVTKAGSGSYNALTYKTFNRTTADALSLSGYLYNLLSGQLAPVPFTITTDTTVASNCMTVARVPSGFIPIRLLGEVVRITFRGTTVSAQILGISSNFYPDRASVQLYFSPSLGVPFTLDSTTNGVLDTNRLGYP